MNIKMKICRDDSVIIIAGKDRGKTGKVLKVLPKENKVVVSGVNVVHRHTKPSKTSDGGIISKEMPVHASNVSHYDMATNKPTKIKMAVVDGKKVRVSKATGEVIKREGF